MRLSLYPVAGQAIGQVALIAATPLLTRIYSPADFGALQFALVFAACCVPVATLRAELVIPALRFANYLQSLLVKIRWVAGALLMLVTAAAVVAYSQKQEAIGETLIMTALITFALAWNAVDSAMLVRSGNLRRLGARNLINGTSAAAFQVMFGSVLASPVSLAFALALGRVLSVALTAERSGNKMKDFEAGLPRYRRKQAAAGVATGVLLGGSLQAPAAAVGYLVGSAGGGFAATAQRVAGGPSSLVGLAVGQVVGAKVSRFLQSSEIGVHAYLRRVVVRLFAISACCGLLIAVLFFQYSEFIFGPDWGGLGPVIAILTPMYVVQFAVTPITVVLPLIEKQGLLLRFEVVRVVAIMVGLLAGYAVWGDLVGVVIGWSLVGTILYLALGWLVLRNTVGR